MTSTKSARISLQYGRSSRFTCQVDAARVVTLFVPPPAATSVRGTIRENLRHPLEFPPLEQAVIPEDRVTIALDAGTPHAADIVAEVWSVLEARGIQAANVTILQTPALPGSGSDDPRCELPPEHGMRVKHVVHDPRDANRCGYLASTAGGDRIYLARELLEADVVLSVGRIAFDPVLGYRGTNSVFYPALSDQNAHARSRGQGHTELGPDDARPLREFVDEIAWLLGTQFTVQVVPSCGTGLAAVFAGAIDHVFRTGRTELNQRWRLVLPERAEIVVVAVDQDAAGHGWAQLGSAVAAARNLVTRDGRIIVLTDLDHEPGEGIGLLRRADEPADALKPLRLESPSDLIPATQLINGLEWGRVSLRSRLDTELLEDLFITPLNDDRETMRLLAGNESCTFVGSAQHVFGCVAGAGSR